MIINGNGILAESGRPALAITEDDLYELVRAEFTAAEEREKHLLEIGRKSSLSKMLGIKPGLDPQNLASVRWGIIWPPEPLTEAEASHKALMLELIEHRSKQIGGLPVPEFYFRKNWDYDDFLWEEGRHIEPGDMNPDVVPYYLTIVGSPSRIPWEFQQYLDVEYAVGRIWFDDLEDCRSYLQRLLAYERGAIDLAANHDLLVVGTQHKDNRATQNSANHLVVPLFDHLIQAKQAGKLVADVAVLVGQRMEGGANKTAVLKRLQPRPQAPGAPPSPLLLFFAGHGLEFETPSAEQVLKQGALICQDWPNLFASPLASDYIAAADVSPPMNLTGMMAFCFACYSAGTPRYADWQRSTLFRSPAIIAKDAFVARLPQKMLARGALAFIGHVSKAWESSFLGVAGNQPQLGGFTTTIDELLRGSRIGHATDYLNTRWLHLTALLDRWIARNRRTKQESIALWQARNDIRGYAILGDPAAKTHTALLR